MSNPSQSNINNNILAIMDADDFDRIAPSLERVALKINDIIEAPNQPIENIYFPGYGILSVLAQTESEQLEVGIIGPEGMSGLAIVHGTDMSPEKTFVQVACNAWKLPAHELRKAIRVSQKLQQLLLLYSRAHLVQVTQSALAYGRFSVESRLARWILMSQDRVQSDEIKLTHEFLALMLGSRRAGVTVAVHILEGVHAIRATRGVIKVRDRARLIEAADGSYGIAEGEYERLLGKILVSREARGTRPSVHPGTDGASEGGGT